MKEYEYLNDKYYYGNEKDNSLIYQMRKYYEYDKEKEKQEKEENILLINLYDEFIEKTAHTLKKLNKINNIFLYPLLLSNLIALGITSEYNKEFNISNSFDLSNHLGINVILGEGVCRNVNSFANDIFTKLGISSYPLMISLNNEDIKPNHFITLVKLNNKYYGLDIYNNLFFNYIDHNHLNCINDQTLNKSKVPIFQYYAYLGLSDENINEIITTYKTKTNIDLNYLNHLQNIANDIISSNNNDLYEYYQETSEIKNKIKSIFKNLKKKKN